MSVFYGRALTAWGGSDISAPIIGKDFNWTGGDGTYQVRDDGGGNWRIKFLTSGVFTPLKDMTVDAFIVGGGGSGSYLKGTSEAASGGAGGFTKTIKAITLKANTPYNIIVGAGGAALTSNSAGNAGGATSAFEETADGGLGGSSGRSGTSTGGSGGSGGGGSDLGSLLAGNGGSDGSDGTERGGSGQGATTREFGEATGKLYSGGGGGYMHSYGMITKLGTGGDGGGADAKSSAPDNTGGGGGAQGGAGGSGIVVIRKHKEAAA